MKKLSNPCFLVPILASVLSCFLSYIVGSILEYYKIEDDLLVLLLLSFTMCFRGFVLTVVFWKFFPKRLWNEIDKSKRIYNWQFFHNWKFIDKIVIYEWDLEKGIPNGKGKRYYKNWCIRWEWSCLNGNLHWKWIIYYQNGNKSCEWQFIKWRAEWYGKMYYENGNLMYEWYLKNYEFEGRGCFYYDNENNWICYSWNYKHWEFHWLWEIYDEAGGLSERWIFVNWFVINIPFWKYKILQFFSFVH